MEGEYETGEGCMYVSVMAGGTPRACRLTHVAGGGQKRARDVRERGWSGFRNS